MTAPEMPRKPAHLRFTCPRCDAIRGERCRRVTAFGFIYLDTSVRTHEARLAKAARARWRRIAGGKK